MTEQVWSHYATYHPHARLDAKRRKCITDRLAERYGVEELCAAIDGCHNDPWYQGDNDRGTAFCELTLILRDAAHVEKFISLFHNPRRPRNLSGRDVTRMAGGSAETERYAAGLVVRAAQR
jgi:hypothetical protein